MRRLEVLTLGVLLCALLSSTVGQRGDADGDYIEEDYIEEEDPKALEKCSRRIMDLVFIMDESSSIPPRAFDAEKELVTNVIKLLDVGETATRVGLLTFSSQARTQFTLDRWYTKSDMIKAVRFVRQMGGNTATGDSLRLLRETTFVQEKGARMNDLGVPKVVIVITDGNSQRHDLTVMEAMKTKISGITIFSVAVGEKINHNELQKIASNVDHVVEKVEVRTAEAACAATPPPELQVLKECQGVAVDVIFVIDTSNTIMDHQFQQMIDFMAKLVMTFDISEEAIHVAVITFANRPKAQIELRDYTERIGLAKAIYAVHRQYGGSYTYCAIDLVLEHGLLEEYGARKDAAKVGVVLTDGKSADPIRTELRAAEARQAGIRMIAVGIGDMIDGEELKQIAGDDRMVFTINDFDSLPENIIPLAQATCKNVPPAPKATEPPIEISPACLDTEADVMFLVDSSDDVTNTQYSQIKNFLMAVAMRINVAPGKTKMGVIQYGRQADIVVDLNRYDDRSAMRKTIKRLRRTRGYRNTGNAIKVLRKRAFMSSNRNAPKVAVIITTGESEDTLISAKEAHMAKRAGIIIYVIGVGQSKDADEIVAMAHDPNRVYLPRSTDSMDSFRDEIIARICREKPLIPAQPVKELSGCRGKAADVGFILDNSGSVRPHQYVKMMQFVENLVLSLDVERNLVRITVVTYANDAQLRLRLDELFDPISIVEKLMSMRRQRGGTNTAEALRMFREEALSGGNGARKDVAQVGVLVTDGKSKETAMSIEEASAVRASGIVLFVVGVGGNLDRPELEGMVGRENIRKNLFVAPDFGALVDLSDEIAKVACQVPPPMKPVPLTAESCEGKPVDVILVLDNSGSVRPTQYIQMMDFIETLVLSFDVAEDKTRIGTLTFANTVETRFYLNKHFDPLDVIDALQYKRQRGGTNTADALKTVREDMFRERNGGRQNVLKVVIVVTDGESRDTPDTLRQAQLTRDTGAVIFAVGVGGNLNKDELRGMAGTDNKDRVFLAESFDALATLNDEIVQFTCEATLAPPKPSTSEACKGKPADVVLILDNSGSVRPPQYKKMMEFVETLVLSFDVGTDKTRIGVMTFANDAEIRFDLNKYNDAIDVVDEMMSMKRQSGGTNTGQALQYLRERMFVPSAGARPGILKVAIVITDGKSRDTDDTLRQAAKVRSLGYIIYAVGVGTNLDIAELEGIAGLNYPDRFYSAETFDALVSLNDKIIKTTCDAKPAPPRPPIIEACKAKPTEIVFVLDNSGSVSNVNYGKMMEFVESLVLSLDVGPNAAHIAAVTFANDAQMRFLLTKYYDPLDIVAELMAMKRQIGGTNTAEALAVAREQVLSEANGARPGIVRVVIVITDGKSRDTPATLAEAEKTRKSGAIIYSVGVGTNLDMDELRGIAGARYPENTYSATSFDGLVDLNERLIKATCDATPAPEPEDACVGKPADVALILDNSGSVRPPQYKKMMEFVETLILSLDVAQDKTRIAVITFANDAMSRFDLNKYGDSLDVVDELMSMKRQSGGTNTAEALQMLREQTFTGARGARPGVLKVGIVITDGKSRDTPATLRQAAMARSLGYVIFAVGVGGNLDMDELQGISGLQYPERFYAAETFDALVSLNDKIVKTTCDATPPPPRPPISETCKGKPADVLFVLDNSGSVSNVNYGRMMEFVESLTLSFDIGTDKTRIGLISYANDAQLRMKLNQFYDTLDVVAEMMSLTRMSGGTNTAGALQLAREAGFSAENGGREKILEVVIVITDGKSRDTPSTLDEAAKLRDIGVVVFAVGVGNNLDTPELKGIAGAKFVEDRYFESETFEALTELNVKITETTCLATPPSPKLEGVAAGRLQQNYRTLYTACVGKPADVVLVLDNSGSIRPNQYTKMMEFIETLILSFDVSQDVTRIGLITFANDALLRFNLKDYDDALDVVDAMMTMKRQRGGTNTADALKVLREVSFKEESGARPGILKVAIVITDGKSRDTDATLRQAALSRSLGYIIYAVGVGTNLDIAELEGIAGLQFPDRFYSAESFDALVDLNDKIIQTTCDATAAPTRPPILETCKGKPVDLAFALDNSGSVSNVNYGKMMEFVESLVLSLDVSPTATQVAVLSFANDALVRFRFNKFQDAMDMVAEMMSMTRQRGGTNTADALKLTREDLFLPANGARGDVVKVAIVITDGKSRDTPATLDQAAQLRKQGVIVFAVGVGTNLDMEELKGISGPEYPDRMYAKEDFDALVDLNDKLIQTTCDATPQPPKLEACVGKPADVVLVLDNSGSIRPNQYTKMMEFIETLVLSFDVSQDVTRIGLITFANDAMLRFNLKDYDDALDVVDAMMTMKRQRGGTNTADALKMLRETSFQESSGARPGILKVAIVITDGKSRDTDATLRQAALSRSLGYIIYAVGVGRNLDIPELEGIAGLQYPDRFYSAESFDALVDLNDKIIQTTCDATAAPTRAPVSEDCLGKPVDLLFALDNSGSVSNVNYGKMMEFVESLVLSLDIGPDSTRISVLSFANDAMTRFHFNKFNDAMDIVGEMMAMKRQRGGTNTADALKLAREEHYQAANGARDGVVRVVIVITDGKSRDTPATMDQAAQLRGAGAIVFAVGVGTNLDMEELKGISGPEYPDRMYAKEDFDALVDLNDKLVETTCTATAPPQSSGIEICRDKIADITLIVDRSTDLSAENFKYEIGEIIKFVENFDIGPAKTMFAIASATGENPVIHSKFGQTKSFNDVKAVLDGLTQEEGINNIGPTIDLVRTDVMTAANGARDGVLRVVLVFLNKKAHDKTILASAGNKMRSEGDTKVFSLAWIGDADFYEAMDIAGEEFYERIIEMEDLTKLQENFDRITEKICNNDFQSAYYREGKYYPPVHQSRRKWQDDPCTDTPREVDIVLHASSRSSKNNRRLVIDAADRIVTSFQTENLHKTRYGLITFAGRAKIVSRGTNGQMILHALNVITPTRGRGRITRALQLLCIPHYQQTLSRVAVLVTDYIRPREIAKTKAMLERCPGVKVYAVGVGQRISEPVLREVSAGRVYSGQYERLVQDVIKEDCQGKTRK